MNLTKKVFIYIKKMQMKKMPDFSQNKDLIRVQNKRTPDLPVCRYPGCNARLTPVEDSMGCFCLHHSLLNKKQMEKYIIRQYKYDYQQHIWIKVRTYNVNSETFVELMKTESDSKNPFYMYEFLNNDVPVKVIYLITPNLVK